MTDPRQHETPSGAARALSPADEKLWATLVHVGGIVFHVLPSLVGYVLLRDRGDAIRQHTASALNFQLTLIIVYVVGLMTALVLVGFVILLAGIVANVVFSILAALAAQRGEHYRYPLSIRFAS